MRQTPTVDPDWLLSPDRR